tara:strand:- start:1718 stop:2266 length:549 start_codon:yes stop_codon:yes gene_type:complete
MTNAELNGLAKNRYIPEDIQLAIEAHPYRLAKQHLSWNEGITTRVAEKLWHRKGFVLKCNLVAQGKYTGQPEKYRELYADHGSRLLRGSWWRFSSVFLSSPRFESGADYTPSDIIDKIYDSLISDDSPLGGSHGYSQYFFKNSMRKIVEHPNCSIETAVKISATIEVPEVRKAAFDKIAKLS